MFRVSFEYLAGIIDGEGCVYIYRRPDGRYRPEVRVTNTKKALMEMLKAELGGNVFSKQHSNSTWKPGFDWVLTGGRAVTLLETIEPFLLLKKTQAQLVLDVPRFRTPSTIKDKWTPTELAHAKDAYEAIQECNRRGNSNSNGG